MLFGGKKIKEQQAHIDQLQGQLEKLRGFEIAEIESLIQEKQNELNGLYASIEEAQEELADVRQTVVKTEETALLQTVGIYEYSHPLDDSVQFKDELERLKSDIKDLAKVGAINSASNWEVNGSKREGTRLAKNLSKLMLRAYNTEADVIIRKLKPHTVHSAVERLNKAKTSIEKLGEIIALDINDDFHKLRIKELKLTADFLAKQAEEKEIQREERQRQREEEIALREMAAETAKLEKEKAHYLNALEKLGDDADESSRKELLEKLEGIGAALDGIEDRKANIRAGYVYVISNFGSFGGHVVKIGMTRRLDPMDRVRELGDASVPFNFDVHAIIFAKDAVGLEAKLHEKFSDKRVNLVNKRREYFYITPAEVKQALVEYSEQQLLEFHDEPEAIEWRASGGSERASEFVDSV